jgi:hypothetical protein
MAAASSLPASRALGPAPVLTDPTYQPKASYGFFDRQFLKLINDPRDLPFVRFMVEATLVLIPIGISLFFWNFPWWVGGLYWALNFGNYLDRYILILHCSSHRPLFKKEYGLLNLYIPWVIGPFIGETPETYFAHHIGMHHPENNLGDDLSTTMPFERDRATHWLQYFGTFFFAGIFQLVKYHATVGKPRLVKLFLAGEVGFIAMCVALSFVSFKATFVVFIFPVIFARIMMMAGNWAQHAFIDAADPANPFKNSITVINCRYNRRSFNDGYHIGHHRLATRHWTEMPVEFARDLQKYCDNDAIIFEGIDFTGVWVQLMLRNYGTLADKFVDLRAERRSRDEIIALLKERTRPLEAPKKKRRARGALEAVPA